MVRYRGQDLFSSGPHRVRLDYTGRTYLPPLRGSNVTAFTEDFAVAELEFVQVGRLVAGDETALWLLVDAVVQASEDPIGGPLELGSGKTWQDVRMLQYRAQEPVRVGRVASVGYEVRYRKLFF